MGCLVRGGGEGEGVGVGRTARTQAGRGVERTGEWGRARARSSRFRGLLGACGRGLLNARAGAGRPGGAGRFLSATRGSPCFLARAAREGLDFLWPQFLVGVSCLYALCLRSFVSRDRVRNFRFASHLRLGPPRSSRDGISGFIKQAG